MHTSLCRRCGTPTTALGLRSDAIFCTAHCRGRFHNDRNRALLAVVVAQAQAIDEADFLRLEELLAEARVLVNN